jgi:hypothetical protein
VFGTWQFRTEAWTTVQVGVDAVTVVSTKGRSMNPMRGVQPRTAFGPLPALDRANRYASVKESCRSLDPMRSIHDVVAKAKRTITYGVPATTRHCFGGGCEIALELRHANLERSWEPVRDLTPGS